MTKRKTRQTHEVTCTGCKELFEVGINIKDFICSNCTIVMMLKKYGLPKGAIPKKNTGTKRPPGWHFYKEFVDKDGTVYHKGVEQPELKGTKKPTKVKKKKKKKKKQFTRREKEQQQRILFKEINEARRAINRIIRAGKKRGIKGLEKKINKLQKKVRKYL